VISTVSPYSEIPCSIRVVEDGYGDARLSWFSSVFPGTFVTTSSPVLDLCVRIQGPRVRFASWNTVMVKQDCCGFPQYLRASLLRHQLSSICVCVFRVPVLDTCRGRWIWLRNTVVVFFNTSGHLCYNVIRCPRSVSAYSGIPCSIRVVKTIMVTQDFCGFPQYPRTALLRRHQLASNPSTPFRITSAYNQITA
jgi:hypothetical protein